MEDLNTAPHAGSITAEHLAELAQAKQLLENPGYVSRVTDMIGMPLEAAVNKLPAAVKARIADLTTASLGKCMDVASATLRGGAERPATRLHSAAVALTGAAGGVFGLAGLAVELPVTTVLMLRSIADIGRANGEAIGSTEAQLACLMVFSLGGPSKADDAAESGYYAARIALSKAIAEASSYLTKNTLGKHSAPAIVRLISMIAARFNVQVSQKAAAMMVPIVGAAGGAVLNTLFINHFQDMARGHFTVRRLERAYGAEAVRAAYQALG
ncbi:MAG: EcsC family protein [Gammaproteobacteria bacterium]